MDVFGLLIWVVNPSTTECVRVALPRPATGGENFITSRDEANGARTTMTKLGPGLMAPMSLPAATVVNGTNQSKPVPPVTRLLIVYQP